MLSPQTVQIDLVVHFLLREDFLRRLNPFEDLFDSLHILRQNILFLRLAAFTAPDDYVPAVSVLDEIRTGKPPEFRSPDTGDALQRYEARVFRTRLLLATLSVLQEHLTVRRVIAPPGNCP